MLRPDRRSTGQPGQSVSNVVRFLGYPGMLAAGRSRGYDRMQACELNLDRDDAEAKEGQGHEL